MEGGRLDNGVCRHTGRSRATRHTARFAWRVVTRAWLGNLHNPTVYTLSPRPLSCSVRVDRSPARRSRCGAPRGALALVAPRSSRAVLASINILRPMPRAQLVD
eukprot:285688-Prymnesium_polylepis.1